MPRSFAHTIDMLCSRCNQIIHVEFWLIVDIEERPDLLAQILDESIHDVQCVGCAHSRRIDMPMLIHHTEKEQAFFVPGRDMDEKDAELVAGTLLGQLAETYDSPPEYLRQSKVVFHPQIRLAIERGAAHAETAIDISEQLNVVLSEISRISQENDMPRRVELYRRALSLAYRMEDPALWATLYGELGNSLYQNRMGDRAENIEEAIRCYKKSLEVATRAAMPAEWADATMNMASAYYSRIRGVRADNIEKAIRGYKQALEVTTHDAMPVEWAETTMNLANAYSERIQGDRVNNIEKAIHCYEQALEVMTREGMPVEWASSMMNLASAYTDRIRGDQAENIEEAIRCYKLALEVRTRDAMPAEWAEATMNLATAYYSRIPGDQAENIEKAIRHYEQALEVRSRDAMPVEWATTIMNLANAYADRLRGDRAENIEKAIRYYKQALEVRTRGAMPVEWADATMNLASAYYSRIRGDRGENIETAVRFSKQTLEVMTRDAMPSDHRLAQHNLGWLCLNERRWDDAAEAFAGLLEANEILYKAAELPESRQSELREVRGIAARLAWSLVKSPAREDRSEAMMEAVEVLERHRARWLREALAFKNEKPGIVPDAVWNDFKRCRKEYNQLLSESRLPEDTPGRRTFLELGAVMRETSEMLDTELARIRELEPAFMPEPDFKQIRSALSSEREALVYFAVTPVGAVSFIIRLDNEPVSCIWLDDLTEETLSEKTQNYLRAYAEWRTNPEDFRIRTSWFDVLDATANWLLSAVMGPLTGKLVESGITCAFLIPQGWLGLLPLHAAWTEENGKRRYALDDVCYAYAPNALSLAACCVIAKQNQSERMLAIDEPYAENVSPLPNSNAEVTAVCHHFTRHNVLADEMATRTAVRDALSGNDICHFSCHGMADFNEPLNSGLLMANGETLTLRDFLSTEGISARLAVLSACETGIPDLKNADEVIGLPAGLVQAGVAGVAASLWSVSDHSTMMLMVRFYELWRKDNLEPPEALRHAQIWVRDTTNGQKAEYFGGFLPEFGKPDSQRLPVELADMLYKASMSARPDENDFEHPFYWAAFTFTGV